MEESQKNRRLAEVLGEVAKQVSSAFAGVIPSARYTDTSVVESPAKSTDNWSKCYKQLGDLSELRISGVLTEECIKRKSS